MGGDSLWSHWGAGGPRPLGGRRTLSVDDCRGETEGEEEGAWGTCTRASVCECVCVGGRLQEVGVGLLPTQ